LKLYFTGDPLFASISRAQLIAFFAWLQDEYVSEPDGAAPRGKAKLSAKTVFNIHTNLSSLWSWAVNEELVPKNIIRTIDPPPVSDPVIETFTKDEIAVLLKACDVTHTWKNRAATTNARSTAFRDRGIVFYLSIFLKRYETNPDTMRSILIRFKLLADGDSEKGTCKCLFHFIAGVGFEPTTSGL